MRPELRTPPSTSGCPPDKPRRRGQSHVEDGRRKKAPVELSPPDGASGWCCHVKDKCGSQQINSTLKRFRHCSPLAQATQKSGIKISPASNRVAKHLFQGALPRDLKKQKTPEFPFLSRSSGGFVKACETLRKLKNRPHVEAAGIELGRNAFHIHALIG